MYWLIRLRNPMPALGWDKEHTLRVPDDKMRIDFDRGVIVLEARDISGGLPGADVCVEAIIPLSSVDHCKHMRGAKEDAGSAQPPSGGSAKAAPTRGR